MKYGKRSKFKTIASSPVSVVFLIMLLGFLTKASWNVHVKNAGSERKYEQYANEYSRLEERRSYLSAQISNLSTEQGVANEIRTKFKGAKEGELLAIIVDEEDASTTQALMGSTSDASSGGADKPGWFTRMLRAVGL